MDCKLRAKNCGGCPMLATEYAAQLKKKEADVRALLGKYGPVAPIRGMETPYHYRNKAVSYTHLRAHETDSYLVCRLLLEKKKKKKKKYAHN